MEEALAGHAGDAGTRGDRARPRRRASVLGVIGELLITAGVITLLYVVWQLWVGDMIYGAERNATGHELSEVWAQEFVPPPTATAEPEDPDAPVTAEPVILAEPGDGEEFGVLHVPRFGSDYAVPMAGGVTRANTLDPIGIGHYPGTSMPGEPGNFAVAAHRTTWGKPFNRIADLHVGDAIVVETQEGWYTYRFRTLEYVTPDEVEVLLPVPQALDVPAGTPYMTMTSCSPMYSLAERIVAYGVFDSFTPRSAGAPASLTEAAA
ncbi:class E sortase [Microbacterium sp. CFBP9034]|uniref:class E sortase n=1 Tax=Microbacterium sp. CFBP9034 TaxID=3096540 RepID=UPI002A6ABFB8|nr:class E sortase [Microbacterium sp. CFBP9034]MDY0908082.1 class E sortase [Microbacterium sp. CFBP9034]